MSDKWKFELGEKIKDKPEYKMKIGEKKLRTSTKEIVLRLRSEDDDKQYYSITTGTSSLLLEQDVVEERYERVE